MALRDHFNNKGGLRMGWDAVHGMWPGMMTLALRKQLPKRFVAGPNIKLGGGLESDVAARQIELGIEVADLRDAAGGLMVLEQKRTTHAVDFGNIETYEVNIYQDGPEQRLVAVIELVSPANKDRPASREKFVSKCASLLREGVTVAIIDIVTEYYANLANVLLEKIGTPIPRTNPPRLSASVLRRTPATPQAEVDFWQEPLVVGRKLPVIPLWLDGPNGINFDLNESYEATCEVFAP